MPKADIACVMYIYFTKNGKKENESLPKMAKTVNCASCTNMLILIWQKAH